MSMFFKLQTRSNVTHCDPDHVVESSSYICFTGTNSKQLWFLVIFATLHSVQLFLELWSSVPTITLSVTVACESLPIIKTRHD